MLNGEIKSALRLDELVSDYVYLDLSHHSLHLHSILRYLPVLTADLLANPRVRSVDFIFRASTELDEHALKRSIGKRSEEKRVSVIFVEPVKSIR